VLFEILSKGLLIHTRARNIHGFREFRKHKDGELCREYMRMLRHGRSVDVSGICVPEGEGLLHSLLHVDPKSRSTVEAAIAHPWIVSKRLSALHQKGIVSDQIPDDMEEPKSPSKKNARGGC